MKTKMPAFLKPGDKIGLTCTARSLQKEQLVSTIKKIEDMGFEAVLGASVDRVFHQFGGDDALRARSFQNLLDDASIKAIWICRGGYGTIRIIDQVNFDHFEQNSKWIMGYSDVTVLHNIIAKKTMIPSLHCMMPSEMDVNEDDAIDAVFKVISGKDIHYCFKSKNNKENIQVTGRLLGGNLSILYSLLGGKHDIDNHDCILFIEEIDEYLYHIDRMMYALKDAGKFDGIKALVVGGMTDMNDHKIPFGWSAQEIIENHIRPLNIPLFFDFPFGHMKNNLPILLNHPCEIKVENGETHFKQYS